MRHPENILSGSRFSRCPAVEESSTSIGSNFRCFARSSPCAPRLATRRRLFPEFDPLGDCLHGLQVGDGSKKNGPGRRRDFAGAAQSELYCCSSSVEVLFLSNRQNRKRIRNHRGTRHHEPRPGCWRGSACWRRWCRAVFGCDQQNVICFAIERKSFCCASSSEILFHGEARRTIFFDDRKRAIAIRANASIVAGLKWRRQCPRRLVARPIFSRLRN